MPRTPFIHRQFHAPFAIEFAYDLPVIFHKCFHTVGAFQRVVPFILSELVCDLLSGRAAVVMQTPSVKFRDLTRALLRQALEELSGPIDVAAIRTRAY